MIEIIENEDIMKHIEEYEVILVPTNINQILSNGFQGDISSKFPFIEEENLTTKYGDLNKLGTIVECKSNSSKVLFILLYISKTGTRPDIQKEFVNYEALEKCLKLINSLYAGKRVAAPFIGTSKFDGNGDKEKIIDLINKCITKCDMTIFDYKQKSRSDKFMEQVMYLRKLKQKDYKLYLKEKENIKKNNI